jgi:hypothetical protein
MKSSLNIDWDEILEALQKANAELTRDSVVSSAVISEVAIVVSKPVLESTNILIS